MFGIGPAYLFILQHRLPVGLMRSRWQFWLSAIATNLAIAILAATTIVLVGLGPFLFVQLLVAARATGSPGACCRRTLSSYKASSACAWCFGTRRGSGRSHFASCVNPCGHCAGSAAIVCRRQEAGDRRQGRRGGRQSAERGRRVQGRGARQIRPAPSKETSNGIDPDHRCIVPAVRRRRWILGSQARYLVTERASLRRGVRPPPAH